MSDIAQPDVSGSDPRPSVQDGLTGGDFGTEERDADPALSITALLNQEVQDEPVETPEAPQAGTTPEVEIDNSDDDDGENLTPEQKQIKELHALLGRQSNELGELRKLVQGQSTDDEDEPEEQYTAPALITEEIRDEIETFVVQNGGAEAASWAAVNRPDLYETVLDVWAEQSGADARRAAEFNFRYQSALAQQASQAEETSQAEFVKTLEADLDTQVAAMAPDYGFDVGNEAHDAILAAALGDSPKAIQDLVVSRDPEQREAGLRAVFAMAVVKAGVTTPEADGAAQQAMATAQAVSKGAASVGTGGLKPVAPPAPVNEEQAIEAAIATRLLARPSTSVSEGLTGGGFGQS